MHYDADELLDARNALRTRSSNLHQSRSTCKGVVIYLASQHPLVSTTVDGPRDTPGPEFAARIERAATLAKTFDDLGWTVSIVASGNLHQDDDGIPDALSLRDAGIRGLVSHGVREDWIVPETAVERYRPDGVYCTEDEVAVAAGVFRDDPIYSNLIGVCGQAQALRVLLAAQNEGVPIQVETPLVFEGERLIDPAHMWHEPSKEVVVSIPATLTMPLDPDVAAKIRAQLKVARKPDVATAH